MAVDERCEVIGYLFHSSRYVAVATNVVGKSTCNAHIYRRSAVCEIFLDVIGLRVRLMLPVGRRQTNYLIRWTQANQLAGQLMRQDE